MWILLCSTKEYDSHALDPLTDKFNKQVCSLQKQSSVHIFFIGTGIVLCMRYQDGQEWQQSGPYSLSHMLCLTPWLKAIQFHHRTLCCDNVRSSQFWLYMCQYFWRCSRNDGILIIWAQNVALTLKIAK